MASPAKEAKVRDLFQNLRRYIDHDDFAKAYKASNDLIKNFEKDGEKDAEKVADAKRARRLLSWSSKTVTIKCYFLDYSNLEQIIKKILKSYIDLKNLITQCLNLFFKCGFCDSSQFN